MIKHRKGIIIAALTCLAIGFAIGIYVGKSRGIPFITTQPVWSIGIYTGESPFNLAPPENINNPVLTARDVTDVTAEFVADPFMVKEGSSWYMFFEVWNSWDRQGDIGLAVSSDGVNWAYKQIVLNEAFHLSYPYVFKWKNEYYMIPETYQASSVRLYKAIDFPAQWVFVRTLLYGSYLDPSIFRHAGKWWIFVGTNIEKNDTLRLFYADNPAGPWVEHPASPVIEGDANIARPGGRVLVFDGRLVRYTQDDDPVYGNQVRAFEITELTTSGYKEKELPGSPVLKPGGTGWNRDGMHNIDPYRTGKNKWMAVVDGNRSGLVFGLTH
ncbi:MAG TPA: hypothetical protein ENH24_01430 [Nitrospirae bacterium]|nr:hypothetical protein [Nitrospirota bacterium]